MKTLIVIGMCLSVLMPATSAAGDDDADVNAKAAFASTAAQQALDRYLAEIEDIERVAAKRKEQARRRLAELGAQ